MVELYKSLTGSLGKFVQSWLAPAAIGVGLVVVLLLPIVQDVDIFSSDAGLDGAGEVVVTVSAAIFLAFLFSAIAVPAYRLLEGYTWLPARDRWIAHQRREWEALRADALDTKRSVSLGKIHDKLDRFPREDRNLMPTRLGNILRGGETYGTAQYGLDTVTLWTQITCAADETARNAVDDARAAMDFFLGIWLLGPFFVATSVGVALYAADWRALWGLLAIPATWLAYRGLLGAAVSYAATLRGIVDVARVPLASRLDLELPLGAARERELWEAITGYVAWGPGWPKTDERLAVIEAHRTRRQTAQVVSAPAPSLLVGCRPRFSRRR